MSQPSIFAIGAHPDDVEIYCLGLMLKLADAGWRMGWAVATDGQASLPKGAAPDLRRTEALAAGALVGVTPHLLGLQDGGLDGAVEERRAVRAVLAIEKPTVLITHHPEDYHPDHRTLSRMVAELCPPETQLLYADTMLGAANAPELNVDITAWHAQKRACLAAHVSQKAPIFLPRLDTWSAFRALHSGVKAARFGEGYTPVRRAASHSALSQLIYEITGQTRAK